MDEERFARYAEKLRHAEDRLELFDEWAPQATEDTALRLASFKAFQEVGEALADMCAMITKDLSQFPKDDYSNVDVLQEREILSTESADALRELTGLRNRLVHEYDKLDEEIALSSAIRLREPVGKTLKEVRAWISSNA